MKRRGDTGLALLCWRKAAVCQKSLGQRDFLCLEEENENYRCELSVDAAGRKRDIGVGRGSV